jgi:glucan biosynthesis protein C
MDQTVNLKNGNPQEQKPSSNPSRIFYLDHLRTALVILVVLHHTAVVYGVFTPFYYVELPTDIVLLIFGLFNQAWFMGALFLIAGYFTPGSYDSKGAGSFIKSRLVRLGLPLVFFIFVLAPISATAFWQMPSHLTGITTPLSWEAYPYLLGMGPMWFLAMLLIFTFGYAGWRGLTRGRTSSQDSEPPLPGYLAIVLFTLGLAMISYLFWFIVPLDKEVFDFPTLAYLPQYLSFFVIGAAAYRRNWFDTIPNSMGVAGFAAAAIATVLLFPPAVSSGLLSLEFSDTAYFVGNGTWQSALYALWVSVFAVGMCLAALTFFRRFFKKESRFGNFLAPQSYAVYIFHTPILVFIAVTLKGVDWDSLPKFALVAAIAVPVCFAAAWLIRKIPGVARVI